MTTYFSWRWVFAGEVLIVAVILLVARRIADAPPADQPRLDLVGTLLSASGLALFVFGVLRSGTWGWVQPKPDAPEWLGLSPTIWLMLAGGFVLWVFFAWEGRLVAREREPLVDPAMLDNPQLRGGLSLFFFQYLLQAGLFFVVPLFLSVALGLSAVATGVRLLPLSLTLLIAAIGVPRYLPNASPRRVVQFGLISLLAGIVVLMAGLDAGAGPEIITWPMLLAGLGIGALASQLGAVTVSAVPDEETGEVGGLQNTLTNLGASLGTALAGSVLIASLTTVVHRWHPGQSRRPRRGQDASTRRALRRRPVRVRRRSGRCTRCGRSPARHGGRDRGRERGRSPGRPARRGRRARAVRARGAVVLAADPDAAGRARPGAGARIAHTTVSRPRAEIPGSAQPGRPVARWPWKMSIAGPLGPFRTRPDDAAGSVPSRRNGIAGPLGGPPDARRLARTLDGHASRTSPS